ncbi:MAG TPA: YdcH family protein [Rhizomicrobium sp.]|jgi:hypothetical protein
MRTIEQSSIGEDFADPPFATEEVTALRIRHVELLQSHHDMDDAVTRLSESGTCDELLIARLKKRKLQIKDEIARIAAMLMH